jgi:hypothetical protein
MTNKMRDPSQIYNYLRSDPETPPRTEVQFLPLPVSGLRSCFTLNSNNSAPSLLERCASMNLIKIVHLSLQPLALLASLQALGTNISTLLRTAVQTASRGGG